MIGRVNYRLRKSALHQRPCLAGAALFSMARVVGDERFPGHDDRFGELVSDASAVLGECERDVVRWGWAPADVTLQVPEPMYRYRTLSEDRRITEPFDGEPPDGFLNVYRVYGLDAAGRVVHARRHGQSPWTCGLSWSDAGRALWSATAADLAGQDMFELTSYEYDRGRLHLSRPTTLLRDRRNEGVDEVLSWFEYDDTGRLECVLRASGPPDAAPWRPEVERLWWDDGRLERVTDTYGDASVRRGDSLAQQREAVLKWERDRLPGRPIVLRGRIERDGLSIIYDDRLDRLETEFLSNGALLEMLPASMADAVEAAGRAAIERGVAAEPFLLEVSAGSPPGARLIGDAARRRRQSLPAQEFELFFPEAVELAVVDHASPEALRHCRQIRQMPRAPAPRPQRPDDEEGWRRRARDVEREHERTVRYRQALQTELATRTLPGATDDLVVIVIDNEVKNDAALESQLGQDGAAAFRATLRPAQPIKLPRGPGQLRDLDDVRLLLRSRGVREDLVEPITTRARWGIRLVPGDDRTRLGGLPALGPLAWPTSDGVPLNFVAQLDLAELPDIPDRGELPADGRLLFFYALNAEQPVDAPAAGPDDPARVLYLPADSPDTLVDSTQRSLKLPTRDAERGPAADPASLKRPG